LKKWGNATIDLVKVLQNLLRKKKYIVESTSAGSPMIFWKTFGSAIHQNSLISIEAEKSDGNYNSPLLRTCPPIIF